MLTKRESVDGIVQIWAVPKSQWEIKADNYDGQPFRYQLNRPYQDGSVMVKEYNVSYEVPAGIDLLARAIATLEEQKTTVLAEARKKANEIQQQISQLQLIGYDKPQEAREVQGELMPVYHAEEQGAGNYAPRAHNSPTLSENQAARVFQAPTFDDDIPF